MSLHRDIAFEVEKWKMKCIFKVFIGLKKWNVQEFANRKRRFRLKYSNERMSLAMIHDGASGMTRLQLNNPCHLWSLPYHLSRGATFLITCNYRLVEEGENRNWRWQRWIRSEKAKLCQPSLLMHRSTRTGWKFHCSHAINPRRSQLFRSRDSSETVFTNEDS